MSNKIQKIAFILIISLNIINANEIQSRIVGGEKITSIAGKEYLVALMSKNNGYYSTSCAGTLISPLYVVTASHCISDNDIYVFANNHILPDDQQLQGMISGSGPSAVTGDVSIVERVFYFSDFIDTAKDIALLRLETPITIQKYPSLPTVGQTETLISQNTKMDVTGWGITSPGQLGGGIPAGVVVQEKTSRSQHIKGKPKTTQPTTQPTTAQTTKAQPTTTQTTKTQPTAAEIAQAQSNQTGAPQGAIQIPSRDLHTLLTTTLTKEQCKQDISGNGPSGPSANALNNIICAGGSVVNEKAKGACTGDSGGPLVYKNGDTLTLIGVVSSGAGACTDVKSTNYTKVEAFLTFIDDAKKGNFESSGKLRKGDMKDLQQGWSLIGTEKVIDNNTTILTNDITKIYIYDSKLRTWTKFDINNGVPSSDLHIPPKSGFWVYKP